MPTVPTLPAAPTAPQLAHAGAGYPAHAYRTEPADGHCTSCGAAIDGIGIPLDAVETPTMAAHGDNFRAWGKHICPACAWFYGIGKGRPGNFLATPQRFEACVISLDSVVADKRPWITVLRELATLPADTPVTGVMTTDVKPRVWPRCRVASVGAMGLMLHAPDYDVSAWTPFSLAACLDLIAHMLPPLAAGYAKASLYRGLWRDHKRAVKDPAAVLAWEQTLAPHRTAPHFLPALIAAGIAKGDRHVQPGPRPDRHPQPAATRGDPDHQAQLGLL